MKKVTSKQVMLYVVLFGMLLLIGVYFLVYKAYLDKADAITASNKTLSQRVDELKVYYDNMDTYNADIALMREEIEETLSPFPVDVKEEDMIVLAITTERQAAVAYTNVNIGDRQELYTIPAASVQAGGIEDMTSSLIFVKRMTEYVNVTDYANLKECIAAIYKSDNRLVIDNIMYSYDKDNNVIKGSIKVTFYSVLGTGREYIPQNLPAYKSGLEDLFGTNKPEEEPEAEAGAE